MKKIDRFTQTFFHIAAATEDMEIVEFDGNTPLWNGDYEEPIHMHVPEGVVHSKISWIERINTSA